jgi:hypothetical protein
MLGRTLSLIGQPPPPLPLSPPPPLLLVAIVAVSVLCVGGCVWVGVGWVLSSIMG